MNKEKEKKYGNAKAIGVHSIAGEKGLELLGYEYGIYDYVIIRGYCGDLHRYKIKSSNKGFYFTHCNGCRYFIKDFLVV